MVMIIEIVKTRNVSKAVGGTQGRINYALAWGPQLRGPPAAKQFF